MGGIQEGIADPVAGEDGPVVQSGDSTAHSTDMASATAREGDCAMTEHQDEQHLRAWATWHWKQGAILADLGLFYLLIVERGRQCTLRDEIVVRERLDLLSRFLQGNVLHG